MKIVIYTSDGDQCSDNWFETSMSYRIIAVDFYFSDICQEKHRIMILKIQSISLLMTNFS